MIAAPTADQLNFLMERGVSIFQEVSKVPVTLSLYIVVLGTAEEGAIKLPGDLFELYTCALWTVLKNRLSNAQSQRLHKAGTQWRRLEHKPASGEELREAPAELKRLLDSKPAGSSDIEEITLEDQEVSAFYKRMLPHLVQESYVQTEQGHFFALGGDVLRTYKMLKKVGYKNHFSSQEKRQRVFKMANVKEALWAEPEELQLWNALAPETLGGVPLVKTLSLGDEGEYRTLAR